MLGEGWSPLRASLVGALLGALAVMLKQIFAPGLPGADLMLLLPFAFAATLVLFVFALARRVAHAWLLAREERRRLIRIAPRTDKASPAG